MPDTPDAEDLRRIADLAGAGQPVDPSKPGAHRLRWTAPGPPSFERVKHWVTVAVGGRPDLKVLRWVAWLIVCSQIWLTLFGGHPFTRDNSVAPTTALRAGVVIIAVTFAFMGWTVHKVGLKHSWDWLVVGAGLAFLTWIAVWRAEVAWGASWLLFGWLLLDWLPRQQYRTVMANRGFGSERAVQSVLSLVSIRGPWWDKGILLTPIAILLTGWIVYGGTGGSVGQVRDTLEHWLNNGPDTGASDLLIWKATTGLIFGRYYWARFISKGSAL
ncbi:MAG: hypothetical protein AAFZ07_25715 [Actinomycetota bacterium]